MMIRTKIVYIFRVLKVMEFDAFASGMLGIGVAV